MNSAKKENFKLNRIIRIQEESQKLDFKNGFYKIDILGGWGVRLNEFSISFESVNTGLCVKPKRSSWVIQSYKHGLKSKRVFTVDMVESGEYEIKFLSIDSLELKPSNLPFFSGLQKPLTIDKISIYIH